MSDSSPARAFAAVTASDTVDLPGGTCRALFVGVGGNVSVAFGGATVLFQNVASGAILPIKVARVMLTSTTATGLIALY